MACGAFHFIYTTAKYDETVAFYRDGLGLPVLDSWDERPQARGMLFQAASGIIEVMAHPGSEADEWVLYSVDPPRGVSVAFEVDDVDSWYQQAQEKQLPIQQELAVFNWGHRGFSLVEPNGLIVFIFSAV